MLAAARSASWSASWSAQSRRSPTISRFISPCIPQNAFSLHSRFWRRLRTRADCSPICVDLQFAFVERICCKDGFRPLDNRAKLLLRLFSARRPYRRRAAFLRRNYWHNCRRLFNLRLCAQTTAFLQCFCLVRFFGL